MPTFVPRLVVLALLLSACGRPGLSSATTLDSGVVTPGALFVLPASGAVVAGVAHLLRIHAGDALSAPALSTIEDEFDPVHARVGGSQRNALEPELRDGTAGFEVTFPERGEAMFGCSARGRVVRVDGVPTLVFRHAKTLLLVGQDALDQPDAGAAATRRMGLACEIQPMLDPMRLRPGDELPLRVRDVTDPRASAVVRVVDAAGQIFAGPLDPNGEVRVRLVRSGWHLATATIRRADMMILSTLTFRTGDKP